MAATETRLLLLGAVMLFEPVNGYQVRRELLSWKVDEWARINPGSIYTGLATLTKQGHLERHDVTDGGREVAVYTSTMRGRAEFAQLYAAALESVEALSSLAFYTALSLIPLVDRTTFLHGARRRLDRLALVGMELATQQAAGPSESAPPHVHELGTLWLRQLEQEREWLSALVVNVESGGLAFQGEPMSWVPPADDPGWQMQRDRERYLALLRQG